MNSKNYQLLFFLLFILLTPLSYAVPPYLSISVEENLSFQRDSCLQAAQMALNQGGFQHITQYEGSGTLFAASYQKKHYQYKALVKCLPTDGVIIVVVVADTMKNIRQKADYLLKQIQKNRHDKHAQRRHTHLVEHASIPPYFGISVGKRAFASKSLCLQAAKNSLDNEGFQEVTPTQKYPTLFAAYRNSNPYHYKAVIKCLPKAELVIVVTVANSMKSVRKKAERLLQNIWQSTTSVEHQGIENDKHFEVLEQRYQKLEQRLEQKIVTDCKCFKTLKLKLEELKQQLDQIKTSTLPASEIDKDRKRFEALEQRLEKLEQWLEQKILEDHQKMGKDHKRFEALEQKLEQLEQQLAQEIEDHKMREENRKPEEKEPFSQKEPENITSESETANPKNQLELTSEAWEHTILSQANCLARAKSAVRKSGFSDHFEMNEYSAKGINSNEYIGLIRCVTDEEFVFFWVKGKNDSKREQLLKKLQTHF